MIKSEIKEQAGKIKRKNIPFILNKRQFIAFVARTTNKTYANAVDVRIKKSESGYDEYSLYDENDKIVIEATSGSAAGSAFNRYLSEKCGYSVGMLTTSGILPQNPPKVGEIITERSLYHYRYFLNYCTFGYSFTFYNFKAWEKLIDRMILSGYNLVLNTVAQECVWNELLIRLGFSDEDIKDFLAAPCFMPWLLMMNMSGYLGNYSTEWLKDRIILASKINKRLQDFGIGVMLPGYSGMVPDSFCKYYPNAKTVEQGLWCGYTRPRYLIFDDERFDKVADLYYNVQNDLIGKNKVNYFSSDPFHEGGITEGIDLHEFAKTAYSAMKRNNKKSVWVFQGWENNPKREMLKGIPPERVLVTNLLSDSNVNAGDNFCNRPWVYCTVNNFGGQHVLRGNVSRSLLNPYNCIKNKDNTCVGFGLMPEAVENGEIFYDIAANNSVNKLMPDYDSSLRHYVKLKYGSDSEELISAWKILSEKIYQADSLNYAFESCYIACPSLKVSMVSAFAEPAKDKFPLELLSVVKIMLDNYEKCKTSDTFLFDLVDIVRQLSSEFSWHSVYSVQKAFYNKDITTFRKYKKLFLQMIDLQDKLCNCHKIFLLGNYLSYPEIYAKNEEDRRYYRYLALTLITVWGDKRTKGILNDYAAREYGGLIKDYYKPRWVKFLNELEFSLKNNAEYKEYNFFPENGLFASTKKRYPRFSHGDLQVISTKIVSIIENNRF